MYKILPVVLFFYPKDDGVTIRLVMEFCQGGSLREYLDKKGKLSEAEIFRLLSQLGILPECVKFALIHLAI